MLLCCKSCGGIALRLSSALGQQGDFCPLLCLGKGVKIVGLHLNSNCANLAEILLLKTDFSKSYSAKKCCDKISCLTFRKHWSQAMGSFQWHCRERNRSSPALWEGHQAALMHRKSIPTVFPLCWETGAGSDPDSGTSCTSGSVPDSVPCMCSPRSSSSSGMALSLCFPLCGGRYELKPQKIQRLINNYWTFNHQTFSSSSCSFSSLINPACVLLQKERQALLFLWQMKIVSEGDLNCHVEPAPFFLCWFSFAFFYSI